MTKNVLHYPKTKITTHRESLPMKSHFTPKEGNIEDMHSD